MLFSTSAFATQCGKVVFVDPVREPPGAFCFISPSGVWKGRDCAKDEGGASFAKEVRNSKQVAKAEAFVSALGTFELYVNDALVSVEEDGNRADFLRPGPTDVEKRRFFIGYDITPLWKVTNGVSNRISAFVARTWFSDKLGSEVDVPVALGVKLRLTFEDGSEELLHTDDSWSASYVTPFRRAGIFFGEERDGSGEQRASLCAGGGGAVVNYKFSGEVSPMVGSGISLRRDLAMTPIAAYVYSSVSGATDNAYGRVVVDRRWSGKSGLCLASGERLVVDFGQNAAAVPEIIAEAAKGTVLTFLGAEMLNDSNGEKNRGNDGPEGSIYRENYRTLKDDGALVRYVFAGGGPEHYEPAFTFMGYRYAEIFASGPVMLKSVRSIPVTSITKSMERGVVHTGDADVNRLVENIRWGLYSNYLGMPTDCPQRDERMGWTADTQVFAPAAFRLADVYSFLGKWMGDMRDAQDAKGRYPCVAPRLMGKGCGYGNCGWSDAGVIVPWTAWRMTGDTAIIDANWESMCRFVDFQTATKYRTDLASAGNLQFADWLSYEKYELFAHRMRHGWNTWRPAPPEMVVYWDYLSGCHWLSNAIKMSEMARVSGRNGESERFARIAEEARSYVKSEFFKDGGRLPAFLRDMQTPHLFALRLGLYEDPAVKREAVESLVKSIVGHGNRLQTGFLGTAIIMNALTYDAGRSDLAYTLLLQHGNPSWLYAVDQGATTIWERWDSYTRDRGFGAFRMNSFNHYAYGSVLDWIFGTAAGIAPGSNGGFDKRFVLAPIPDKRLGSIHAEYKIKTGLIVSDWRYDGDRCRWRFEVPVGAIATVKVNGTEADYLAGVYELEIAKK